MLSSFKRLCVFLNKGLVSRLHRDDMMAGTIYMLTSLVMGLVGGVLPLCLAFPASAFSIGIGRLLPIHPLLMQFYGVIPALVCGVSTFFLPAILRRPHMLLGKLNLCASLTLAMSGLLTLFSPASLAMIFPWCVGVIMAVLPIIVTILDSCGDGQERPYFSLFTWSELFASISLLVTVPLFAGRGLAIYLSGQGDLVEFGRQFFFPCDTVIFLCGFGLISGLIKKVISRPMSLVAISCMASVALCNIYAWSRMFLGHHIITGDLESFFGAPRIFTHLAILSACILMSVWIASLWHAQIKATVPVLWGVGFSFVVAVGFFCALSHYPVLHSMIQISALYGVCGAFFIWRDNTHFWYSKKASHIQFALTVLATLPLLFPSPYLFMFSRLCFGASALVFAAIVYTSLRDHRKVQYLTLVHSS